jgi:serine/threonine-protein kinase
VKVLDFGLAKALDTSPAPSSDPANSPTLTMGATTAGAILGTAAYMSPEQAKGRPVDRRADIWAYGVVLMEMLTGKSFYSGETAQETLAAVLLTNPSFDKLPDGTPPSIRRLLRSCLERIPSAGCRPSAKRASPSKKLAPNHQSRARQQAVFRGSSRPRLWSARWP